MKAGWEYLFENKIVKRGVRYFESDSVISLEKTKDVINAVVGGTHDYSVRVKLDGDKILGLGCTCPYGEHSHCKHMAAVILQWEAETKSELYFDDRSFGREDVFQEMHEEVYNLKDNELGNLDLKEIIKSTEDSFIKECFYKILSENKVLREEFLFELDKLNDKVRFELLCSRINALIGTSKTTGYDEEDYYYEEDYYADIYIMDDYLVKEINKIFRKLYKEKKYTIVYKASAYLMEKIQYCHYHNEEVNLEVFSKLCEHYWNLVYKSCSDQEFEELYNWMLLYEPRIIEPTLRRAVNNIVLVNEKLR